MLVLMALALVLIVGCGKGPPSVYDQPGIPEVGRWETVWVDPQLVLSDTLFTLITAGRVDSAYNEKADPFEGGPASVEFAIADVSCPVIINIEDHTGHVEHPLLVRSLPAGFYKFTFHSDSYDPLTASPHYFLVADICGEKQRISVVF
jgi:hypothetical protein